jgi:hypothetical protein
MTESEKQGLKTKKLPPINSLQKAKVPGWGGFYDI